MRCCPAQFFLCCWAWAKKFRPKANLGRRPLGRLWAWANLGPSWYIGPGRFGLGRARPKPIPNLAIASKTEVLIKLLLRYGADVNASDKYGTTPLKHSISQDFNGTKLLLQYGAQTHLKNQIDGNTALHTAIYLKDKMKIEMLSRYGASMHIANNFGNTPLEWALDNYTGSIKSLKIICYHN